MQGARGAVFTLHIVYEQLCRRRVTAIIESTLAVPDIKQLEVVKRPGAITDSLDSGEQSRDGNKPQKGASDSRKLVEKRWQSGHG